MNVRPIVPLTPEQRALAKSLPRLAERVAYEAKNRFQLLRDMKDLVQSAHYGIVLAARDFEPRMGQDFETWASYKALMTILDDTRSDSRQAQALWMGRLAAIEVLSSEPSAPQHDQDDVMRMDDRDRRELSAFQANVLAGYLKGTAADLGDDDEERLIAKLDAAKAAVALRSVYDQLGSEREELLQCTKKEDFVALAQKRGVSHWTLQREQAKLLKVVGARLHGMHVSEMPAWAEELWDTVRSQRSP